MKFDEHANATSDSVVPGWRLDLLKHISQAHISRIFARIACMFETWDWDSITCSLTQIVESVEKEAHVDREREKERPRHQRCDVRSCQKGDTDAFLSKHISLARCAEPCMLQ